MELTICHLYPDLLNSYGDLGNILILKDRMKRRGFSVKVVDVSLGDAFVKEDYDIVFFGGGQDYEQSIVAKDLTGEKKEALRAYVEEGKVLLAICGGYQLLGKYYSTPTGEKLPGLSILDLYTEAGDTRFIGNTIIYNEALEEYYVGFENHSGRTYIGDLSPLGKVLVGYGNNGQDGYEGCVYKNTYCSYFHGSLLSKNPELSDRLLTTALSLKYGPVTLSPLKDYYEHMAKKELRKRYEK